MPAKIAVPPQWPAEVAEKYEPVRHLGKGGFGSVILGKRKDDPNASPKFAALKVVGSEDVTKQEVGYAHRELDILSELSHPNIMKVLEFWEPPRKEHRCAAIMALTFARGPTLQALLTKGGRLSPVFGRTVCAQLVDAIAYVHSRAVLHRDVKPDNIIVSGAAYEVDEIWDDDQLPLPAHDTMEDWAPHVKRWPLTLVDFGFARALTPSDMKENLPTMSFSNGNSNSNHNNNMDASVSSFGSSSRHSKNPKRLDLSTSRAFTRQMSALGNRGYAAPEILQDIKPNSGYNSFRGAAQADDSVDITKNMAPAVSNYGMMADAYSVGSTIKYAMTGVKPGQDIEKAIESLNAPKLGCCGGGGSGKPDKDGKLPRKVQYRRLTEISKEAAKLIEGLTKTEVASRTSIRQARHYPWVDNVVATEAPSSKEVEYLSFTLQTNGVKITEEEG
eukprot:CAMPEP_0168771926 /NCGR_PEP_ID=MMETSP0725-20121227/3690_1 /TAXON_ID=265536 /ORGANISM="Amphiprora sp., Strain CCMP467" /LENGTH=444 /DNA_ID=CAMNT_0008821423 /DNA_START=11 /DNA_END=1345 /DNA_ORIENTATION=-